MLKRKMFRDIKNNVSQFITILLMVLIGVMVYVGILAYMDGMQITADNFYSEYNLQDLNVMGYNFNQDDLNVIKSLDGVNNAELKLVFNAINGEDNDKNFLVSFIESNDISKFYVLSGKSFDKSLDGVWLDSFYALENDLSVGDIISFKYNENTIRKEILGIINVPDHLYDVKDASELVPNRENYGFVYLSSLYFPQEEIPYNYVMVDVDSKDNVSIVKKEIEESVSNAKVVQRIEDTLSYSMFQGEIDEGGAYVGIFSGLFLFIAMLSVITTMTRVVKKQKLQIGTLKALGFKKRKIIIHYVGYGFWISLVGAVLGIIAGRYFIGSVFMSMEMDFFEIPNGKPTIEFSSYLVSALVVLCVSFITYVTCHKELVKSPAMSLRNELSKVKTGNLNITSKGIFKKLSFASIWNLRDIIRNKFRTLTGIVGIVGCSTLIVCAFGMLNSMNYFVKLQFEDLYNFDYKLILNDNLSEEEVDLLISDYGDATSKSFLIEVKNDSGEEISNNIFVYDASNYVRFMNDNKEFIDIDSNDGVYVTYKFSELYGYEKGDTITWHILGDDTYYESKIVGFNKDPQNQNVTMTREYLESLGVKYVPDSIYTNIDLSNNKEIKNVEIVQDIESLKSGIESMLSMMKTMIVIIIVFAVLLGAVIIYNMGVLSFGEKSYQFATLKVLGFKDKQIEKIYVKQNNWITIVSIIIGLPCGYYLTSWLFKACLDDNYDFGVNINLSTYVISISITFLVSYVVSKFLSRKVRKIDMVSSLKGNE